MIACTCSSGPAPLKPVQCEQQDKGGQVAHVGPGQSAGSTLVGQTGEQLLMDFVDAGDVASVRRLISRTDAMAQQGLALSKAFQHGHEELFDLLYAHLSKREIYWSALLCTTAALGTFAAVERERGHMFKHAAFADLTSLRDDPVGYVLLHANPVAWQHLAVRNAVRCSQIRILERLLGLSFPQPLLPAPLSAAEMRTQMGRLLARLRSPSDICEKRDEGGASIEGVAMGRGRFAFQI